MNPAVSATVRLHERMHYTRICTAEVASNLTDAFRCRGARSAIRSCALRILDAATISMALVIFLVFSTDLIFAVFPYLLP